MPSTGELEQRIIAIEARNRRVELDKEWETSVVRRIAIFVSTYVILGIFLWLIDARRPWWNAIVPALGFALSTFAIHPARRWWERRRRTKPSA